MNISENIAYTPSWGMQATASSTEIGISVDSSVSQHIVEMAIF